MNNQTEKILAENSRFIKMVANNKPSSKSPIIIVDSFFCLNPNTLKGTLCPITGKKQSLEHIANRVATVIAIKRLQRMDFQKSIGLKLRNQKKQLIN